MDFCCNETTLSRASRHDHQSHACHNPLLSLHCALRLALCHDLQEDHHQSVPDTSTAVCLCLHFMFLVISAAHVKLITNDYNKYWPQWPSSLRRVWPWTARKLGSRVRIPSPKSLICDRVFLSYAVLCRHRLCVGLITCPRSPTKMSKWIRSIKLILNLNRAEGVSVKCTTSLQ